MRAHEILEHAPGVLDQFAPGLLVEDRSGNGEVRGDEIARIRTQRNAFDPAAKALGETPGRLENGGDRIMLLDGNENVFHVRPPRWKEASAVYT